MPQFRQAATYRFNGGSFSAGLAIFALGLLKKSCWPTASAPMPMQFSKPPMRACRPSLPRPGWVPSGTPCNCTLTSQATQTWPLVCRGCSCLLANFNSPYRATNISDFWRRWHMSLSQFLRDYLYIALGGNRKVIWRYANLMATMVLGGLWHGASWSFVIWGFLHGILFGCQSWLSGTVWSWY